MQEVPSWSCSQNENPAVQLPHVLFAETLDVDCASIGTNMLISLGLPLITLKLKLKLRCGILNREVGILNSLFIYTLQEKAESIPNFAQTDHFCVHRPDILTERQSLNPCCTCTHGINIVKGSA